MFRHSPQEKRDQSNKSPGEEKRLHQGQKHKRKNVRMLLKRQRRSGDETGSTQEIQTREEEIITHQGGSDNHSGRKRI